MPGLLPAAEAAPTGRGQDHGVSWGWPKEAPSLEEAP